MEALAGLSLGVLALIGIIYLAVIVLSIILFFKVWIMCDDVRKIKRHLLEKHSDY